MPQHTHSTVSALRRVCCSAAPERVPAGAARSRALLCRGPAAGAACAARPLALRTQQGPARRLNSAASSCCCFSYSWPGEDTAADECLQLVYNLHGGEGGPAQARQLSIHAGTGVPKPQRTTVGAGPHRWPGVMVRALLQAMVRVPLRALERAPGHGQASPGGLG